MRLNECLIGSWKCLVMKCNKTFSNTLLLSLCFTSQNIALSIDTFTLSKHVFKKIGKCDILL